MLGLAEFLDIPRTWKRERETRRKLRSLNVVLNEVAKRYNESPFAGVNRTTDEGQ